MTTTLDTVAHRHTPHRVVRAFVGLPGFWVNANGSWVRPLHVWLYRGAWRVVCQLCQTALDSGDDLYGGGWPTQAAAFDSAVAHCRSCSVTEPHVAEGSR